MDFGALLNQKKQQERPQKRASSGDPFDDVLAGLADAQAGHQNNFIGKGAHVLKVVSIRMNNGFTGLSMICVFEVLASQGDHREGESVCRVFKLDNYKTRERNLGEMKALFSAISGWPDSVMLTPLVKWIGGSDNPFRERVVYCTGVETTRDGKTYTNTRWQGIQEQSAMDASDIPTAVAEALQEAIVKK